jgi:poly(A) polymerase
MPDKSRNTAPLFNSAEDADSDESPRRGRPPPGLALDPPDDPPPSHPPEIPVDRLDPEALRVVARLRHMRHQAYLVGGCVRDLLLGHTPKDFDVATDAHPGEVRAIFRNCRLIGRRFRLAHVYFRGGKVIEVATFRKNPTEEEVAAAATDDDDLLITRDNVFGTAEEDAVRRDFTVNGLFYDVASGEVIDYVGGRADLESHRIHTIGDPEVRIREDPVRSLRAVRFAARLGFTIAPDTFEAMRRHAGELDRCAPARVLEEIFKILRCAGSERAFQLLRACGALPVILPALGAAQDAWDDARRKGFHAHLGALDRLVRSGAEVSEAVLLGALVMHLRPPAPPDDEVRGTSASRRAHGETEADALLASLVSTSRLPRKVAERVRQALHAQRYFREPPKRRRGRGLPGQPYFLDALQLLEITVEATGEAREVLERWVEPSARGGEHAHEPERKDRPARSEAPSADAKRASGRTRKDAAAPRQVEGDVEAGGAARAETGERAADAAPRRARSERARAAEPRQAQAERDDAQGEREVEDGDEDQDARTEIEVSAGGDTSSGASAVSGEGTSGTRRRRRRRGGRRRRRRGVGAGSEGGSGSSPPATT